jgi:hypothetical protein
MTEDEASFLERQGAVTAFSYPQEGGDSQNDSEADLRQLQLKALEYAARILLASRTMEVARLRIDCAAAIARSTVSVGQLAVQHGKTWARVEQVLKEMENF